MDRIQTLSRLNRAILVAYSRRTTAQLLGAASVLRLARPRLEHFLALNVAKEVHKDALAIARAGEAAAGGDPLGAAAREHLFEATRSIDQAFVAKLTGVPIGVVFRYEEIAPVRLQRIDRLLECTTRILDAWPRAAGARQAVQAAYQAHEFEALVRDVLHLYALETRALSMAMRMPLILSAARERLARGLYALMVDAGAGLSSDVARVVFARRERVRKPRKRGRSSSG